ncbi:unnamed protein product [Boreogadus saida]
MGSIPYDFLRTTRTQLFRYNVLRLYQVGANLHSFHRVVLEGLKADLKSRLFGQHIAAEVIMKAVEGLMNNDNPKKPMVLSFHGASGTGKSLASQLIVKNIYKKGMDSRFVHFFNAAIHFPDIYEVETYKSQLQHWIRGNVTHCARSMFIFDEMDKMHAGVIDGINPFMDYQYKLDGVSYSKAIFIFLRWGHICFQLTDRVVFRRWYNPRGKGDLLQLLVPLVLRLQVLKIVHGLLGVGHYGNAKTLHCLWGRFYWPDFLWDLGPYLASDVLKIAHGLLGVGHYGNAKTRDIDGTWSCMSCDTCTAQKGAT